MANLDLAQLRALSTLRQYVKQAHEHLSNAQYQDDVVGNRDLSMRLRDVNEQVYLLWADLIRGKYGDAMSEGQLVPKMQEFVPLFEDYSALTRVNEILSNVPSKSFKGDDKQVLRAAILAEIDAINLYEQMAAVVKNKKVRETLLDVAREEKTHIGEFQALLLELDPEYERELKAGEKEVQK